MDAGSGSLHGRLGAGRPAVAQPAPSSPPQRHTDQSPHGSSASPSDHDGDADGDADGDVDADVERSSATSLTPDQEVLHAPASMPGNKPDRLPHSAPLHPTEPGHVIRTTSQRSARRSRTPQQARRGSLSYVSHSPLPSRPPSLAVSTYGLQPDAGPMSSASDHPSYMLGATLLSRSPSASSAASMPGRLGRSPPLRYHRGGDGGCEEATLTGRTSTIASTGGRTPTGRESLLVSPSYQHTADSETLVSRSHDLLSEIAARERYLLDLKEEVKRQEQELNSMRAQWQKSVSSTLAADSSNQLRTAAPSLAKATAVSDPARQATETLKNWGGRINSLFVPKVDTGAPSASSPEKDKEKDAASEARRASRDSKAESEAGSASGQGQSGVKPPASEPTSKAQAPVPSGSSGPTAESDPHKASATTWWTKSWMGRGVHVPKPTSAAPPPTQTLTHHGPRIQNGIVIDDVEDGQPTRIFLEELAEEDEQEAAGREEDESTAATPTAPTPARTVAVA